MPGPFLITSDAQALLDIRQLGPFLIGSNLYTIVSHTAVGSLFCEMYKSTDQGVTWVLKDSLNEPVNSSTAFGCCVGGTSLYVSYTDLASGFQAVASFDTTIDAWGTPTITTNIGSSIPPNVQFRVSDTSLIIVATVQAFSPNINNQRCGFFIFDIGAATWGAWAHIGGTEGIDDSDWICHGILQGVGSTFQVVFLQAPSLSGSAVPYNLVIQSLSGTTTGSLVTVDSQAIFASSSFVYPGYSDGTTLVLIWQPTLGTTGPNAITIWKAPVLSMVFSKQVIILGTDIEGASVSIGGDGIVLMLSADVLGLQPLYQTIDSGLGFGPVTQILANDSMSLLIQNAASIIGPFWGLLFKDSGGIWFLSPSPVVLAKVNVNFGGVVILPSSIGSLCKYARPVRCQKAPHRFILSSNLLVYGGGK